MAIPAINVLGNPNVTEGNFQIAIEDLRKSVIGSGKAYDSSNTYSQYDTCVSGGIVYYSKIDSNTGNTPAIGANWGLIGDLITGVVHNVGDETIAGVKTFTASPTVPTPTTNTQAVNKAYVDSAATDRIGLIDYGYAAKTYHILAFGGAYSRADYPKLWAYVQATPGILVTEASWQSEAAAQGGICGYFSAGDGTTTFRVPNLDKAFLRPDSRGVASYQNHAFQDHLHGLSVTDGVVASSGGTGFLISTRPGYNANTRDSITGNVGTETRPKNIAFLPLIVAK